MKRTRYPMIAADALRAGSWLHPSTSRPVRPEPVEGPVVHAAGFDKLSPNGDEAMKWARYPMIGGDALRAGSWQQHPSTSRPVRPEPVEGPVLHAAGFDKLSPNGEEAMKRAR